MAGLRQRVDQPCLHRARVEGEPEPHEDGDDGERDDPGAHLRQRDVEERRRAEHRDREEEGDTPTQRVGDDARRDLEDDHPGGEGGVRDEDLEEAEPRVEEKERIDAPDRRGREGVEPSEQVVAEEDLAARVARRMRGGHAATLVIRVRYAAGARWLNLANRRRNESLTVPVGPFRFFARITSAMPWCSDSSPM